jgi:hypothetical protein
MAGYGVGDPDAQAGGVALGKSAAHGLMSTLKVGWVGWGRVGGLHGRYPTECREAILEHLLCLDPVDYRFSVPPAAVVCWISVFW